MHNSSRTVCTEDEVHSILVRQVLQAATYPGIAVAGRIERYWFVARVRVIVRAAVEGLVETDDNPWCNQTIDSCKIRFKPRALLPQEA
jgi:hypothetical protein